MATPVSDWCIRALQRVISDLARFEDGRSVHLQSLEAQQLQLREAVAVEAIQGGHDVSGAVDLVSEALSIVRCEMEHRESERGYHTILLMLHRTISFITGFQVYTFNCIGTSE